MAFLEGFLNLVLFLIIIERLFFEEGNILRFFDFYFFFICAQLTLCFVEHERLLFFGERFLGFSLDFLDIGPVQFALMLLDVNIELWLAF